LYNLKSIFRFRNHIANKIKKQKYTLKIHLFNDGATTTYLTYEWRKKNLKEYKECTVKDRRKRGGREEKKCKLRGI